MMTKPARPMDPSDTFLGYLQGMFPNAGICSVSQCGIGLQVSFKEGYVLINLDGTTLIGRGDGFPYPTEDFIQKHVRMYGEHKKQELFWANNFIDLGLSFLGTKIIEEFQRRFGRPPQTHTRELILT